LFSFFFSSLFLYHSPPSSFLSLPLFLPTANVRKKLKEGYGNLNTKIEALDFDVEQAAERELAEGIQAQAEEG